MPLQELAETVLKISVLMVLGLFTSMFGIVIFNEYDVIFYMNYYYNHLKETIENMDIIVWPSIFDDISEGSIDDDSNKVADTSQELAVHKKYEDKYLDIVRNMSKDIVFDSIEQEMLNIHKREFYRAITDNYVNSIVDLKSKIDNANLEISVLRDYDMTGGNNETNNKNNNMLYSTSPSASIKKLEDDIHNWSEEIDHYEKKLNDKSQIEQDASEQAIKIILNDRHDKLINSFVIEKTPLGNVLMFYNNKRGTFEYYSDATIPYRYLEVVGRKYVKLMNCRSLYYDMEEELSKCEKKLEERERKEREKRELEETLNKNEQREETKKNVFAKFKSYNKDAGSGPTNVAPPPKNSISNKGTLANTSNEKILIKENANRYTHEGRFSNFCFLKKIPRKVVDKKYALSFSDFKKMQQVK